MGVSFIAWFTAALPTDPLFYLVGGLTIFLMAMSKSAFGGGLALLGVPMFSLVTDPISGAVIIAPLLIVMDLFTMRYFSRSTWSMPDVRWLVPGMIIGMGFGWLFFEVADPRIVALLIGIVSVTFVAHWFLTRTRGARAPIPVSPGLALGLSTASGFTTFVAHAGGPPLAMYLLRRGLDKGMFAGTNLIVFFIANVIKLGPFVLIGLDKAAVDRTWVFAAIVPLAAVIPLGVFVGKVIHDRLDQKTLYLLCYVLVGLAGTKLLWDSLRAFL
jgi:uncharacterized protein